MLKFWNVIKVARDDYTVTAVILLGFWASLTPSLLPRPWYLQIIASSLTIIVFYWIAQLLSLGIHALASKLGVVHIAWFVKVGIAFFAGSIVLYELINGVIWQYEVYRLFQSSPPSLLWLTSTVGVVVGTYLFSGGLIWVSNRVGRGIRFIYSKVRNQKLVSRLSYASGTIVSLAVVTFVVVVVTNGLFPQAISRGMNAIYDAKNSVLPDGYVQPSSPLLSGSNESLTPWSKLGLKGRIFVSGAPTPQEIESVMGESARQPIRVYVGLEQTGNIAEQADIAVAEMKRTGAFDRKAILIAVTTGSGWVDAGSTRPLEYVLHGDVATVATQYSYLPSWLSFVTDRQRVTDSATELIQHVSAVVREMPEEERPEIYVFGESLAAYGIQRAYVDDPILNSNVTSTFLAGPPGFSKLYEYYVESRQPGSPSYNPVVGEDRNVVFVSNTDEYDDITTKPSMLYVVNPTDPVSRWDGELLWSRPPWVRDEINAGLISEHFVWRPIVTFFQVTVDMMLSRHFESGYAHNYDAAGGGAWALITGAKITPEQQEQIIEQLDL